MLVKAFIARPVVEAFDKGILHWRAGRDVTVEPPMDQRSTAALVSSLPLSLTITLGAPRSVTRRSSSRTTLEQAYQLVSRPTQGVHQEPRG